MPLAIRSDSPVVNHPFRNGDLVWPVAVGLIAFVVRMVGATTREPTLGEMAASVAVTTDFWTVFTGPLSEQCPPVLWWLLWPIAWFSGGALEFLRAWIAVISAGACALTYPLFKGLLKPGGAGVAALILAIHPAAVLAGRTVGPEALVLPAFLVAVYFLIRTVEVNRLSAWLLLDIGLVLLLTSHRGAIVAAAGLLLVHLGMIAHRMTHPNREAWSTKRDRLPMNLGIHYAVTAVISLPLAVVILRNPLFPVEAFDALAFSNWWNATVWGGVEGGRYWLGYGFITLGGLLVLPGVVAAPVIGGWGFLVAPLWVLATVLTVLAVSFAPGGFKFGGVDLAGLTVGGIALGMGAALAHAKGPLIWMVVSLLGLGWLVHGIPGDSPNLPIRAVMARVREVRNAEEPVLVWPPYLRIGLRYYVGGEGGNGDLAGYLTGIEESAGEGRIHVALIRWPDNSARTITLRGALQFHSADADVWKAGPLGEVISARDVDRQMMAAWNADPKTLDTDDKPVRRLTMHMWVPTDDLFAKSDQFHDEPAEALFEPSGRRVAWTSQEEVRLDPKVNLAQGSYFVKIHCAPNEEDGPPRQMEVILSAFERKRFLVDQETTLSLAFTTATDLTVLPIRIGGGPMMAAGTGRHHRLQGLKIYSVSVEPPTPFN